VERGEDYGNDDNGIIEVEDLPPPRAHNNEIAVSDNDDSNAETSDDDDSNAETSADNESVNDEDEDDDGDDDNDGAEATGLRRSRRTNKGRTKSYDNYALLLHARRIARGGPRQAIIRDGIMMFSSEDLSDAKPVPVEDRLEYALGIILQQYSIGAGLKKFRERGEKGVTKELSQMHNMSVFAPIMKSDLTHEEKKKAISSLMFLKEKRDKSIKGWFCANG
jgi:hypothetical protein